MKTRTQPALSSSADLRDVAIRVLEHAERLGLHTYDPSDIKAHPLIAGSLQTNSVLGQTARGLCYALLAASPTLGRRALGIAKHAYPHAVSRLAQAHISAARFLGRSAHLDRAEALLQWIGAEAVPTANGIAWTHPVDIIWPTQTIAAGTPIAHTTMLCVDAFLDFHLATGAPWALDKAQAGAAFVLKDLPRTTFGDGRVALAYTSADTTQFINVSADALRMIARLSNLERSANMRPMALSLAQFILANHNADGSWYYHAVEDTRHRPFVDNYHTGMVLSGLCYALALDWGDEALARRLREALHRGMDHFLRTLFDVDGAARFSPESRWPVDGYSCAQGVLTLSDFGRIEEAPRALATQAEATLARLIAFTIRDMINAKGACCWRRYRHGGIWLPSLRWPQSLMAFALMECLQHGAGRADEALAGAIEDAGEARL
jgi:hypothetical protein